MKTSRPSSLVLLGSSLALSSVCRTQEPATHPSPNIRVDQVGFYPDAPKTAVVVVDTGPTPAHAIPAQAMPAQAMPERSMPERSTPGPTTFAVVTADRGDTLFTGQLSAPRRWEASDEVVRQADFSALVRPGRYVLRVPGIGDSYPFSVGPSVMREVARAALKAFYSQRASVALPARYAGRWARAAGHPDTAVLVHASAASAGRPPGTHIAAPRGWYDAGDYNKYVVNSGISTYTLLALADEFPAYAAGLDINIPESGNALPDVLDEALWNLGWMRAMQDPVDGGVYHKLTNAEFSGFVVPAAATAPRYVVQKSTAATLDFAAVAARAALIARRYARALPGLADSLVRESLFAWRWARQHPHVLYD
ncbi:MAG: glycoside hydrolase family 9 protein, partial [Candidatus Eremiobacteraeota bacterium]|nr:glycoside hydrolase family 9 protein [Candidatus Eremiobacteraeota bacterium]